MTLAPAPSLGSGNEPSAPTQASMRSPTMSVVRGALLLLSAQPITWAASALGAIFTPQYLGDDALGAFVLSWTIGGLAGTFVTMGVPDYLVRRVASHPSAARRDGAGALVVLTGAALLVAALLAVVLPLVGFPASRRPLLVLALLGMVVSVAQMVLLAVLRGQEHHARFAWLSAGGVVASNVASIAALMAGGGVIAYAGVIVGTMALTTALIWWVSGLRFERSAFVPRHLFNLARGGFPFLGWNVAQRFRMEVDRLLLGILSTVAVIGWYGAAYRIVGVTVFVPTLITTPLLPALSRHKDDRAVFEQTLRRSIIAALLLTVPICAMIVGVAPSIPATLHWPESFRNSVPLIMILALQMPLVAVDMVIGTGLIALHRERPWFVVAALGAVLNVVANVLLIVFFERAMGNGAIGSATATVSTEVVILIGALILLPSGVINRSVVSVSARIVFAGACLTGVALSLLATSLPLAVLGAGVAFIVAVVVLRVIRVADARSMCEQVARRLKR